MHCIGIWLLSEISSFCMLWNHFSNHDCIVIPGVPKIPVVEDWFLNEFSIPDSISSLSRIQWADLEGLDSSTNQKSEFWIHSWILHGDSFRKSRNLGRQNSRGRWSWFHGSTRAHAHNLIQGRQVGRITCSHQNRTKKSCIQSTCMPTLITLYGICMPEH